MRKESVGQMVKKTQGGINENNINIIVRYNPDKLCFDQKGRNI